MESTARALRPKILNEEFPDNQKLLDNVQVEPTPLTLPLLPNREPPSWPAPSFSRQKRGVDRIEEEDIADTGASGSGPRPAHPAPPSDREGGQPHLHPHVPAAMTKGPHRLLKIIDASMHKFRSQISMHR